MTDRRGFLLAGLLFAALAILCAAIALGATVNVVQTAASPNGAWVVELSDWLKPSQIELRSRPVPTPSWRKVGGKLAPDYDVSAFVISADSQRVVYREGRTALGDWALFYAPIEGGASARISQHNLVGSSVLPGFHLISGDRVRYQYTPDGGPSAWYVVPVTGGRILRELFADGFESGNQGGWR